MQLARIDCNWPLASWKIDAVLTPVMAILQKLKLAPEQRMEWMGYAEMLLRTAIMRCI